MHNLGLISALALVVAVGCDTSTEGVEGNVIFTPTYCGLYLGCAINDGLAVGGTAAIQIMGTDGISTAGADLDVSNASLAQIVATADIGGAPAWQIVALAPGVIDIIAYDADDVELDSVALVIEDAGGLTLDSVLNTAVGPDLLDPTYDEVWSVNADQTYAFQMRAFAGVNRDLEIMGLFDVTTGVDPGLVAYIDNNQSILEEGLVQFNVPEGGYELDFDNGVDTLSVLIDAVGQ